MCFIPRIFFTDDHFFDIDYLLVIYNHFEITPNNLNTFPDDISEIENVSEFGRLILDVGDLEDFESESDTLVDNESYLHTNLTIRISENMASTTVDKQDDSSQASILIESIKEKEDELTTLLDASINGIENLSLNLTTSLTTIIEENENVNEDNDTQSNSEANQVNEKEYRDHYMKNEEDDEDDRDEDDLVNEDDNNFSSENENQMSTCMYTLQKVLLTKKHLHLDLRSNLFHLCSNIDTCEIFTVLNPAELPNLFDNSTEYILSVVFYDSNNANLYFVILEQFFFSLAKNWSIVAHFVTNMGLGHVRFKFMLCHHSQNGLLEYTMQAIDIKHHFVEFREFCFEKTQNFHS